MQHTWLMPLAVLDYAMRNLLRKSSGMHYKDKGGNTQQNHFTPQPLP